MFLTTKNLKQGRTIVAKLNKDRLVFGFFLIILIAIGEIVLGHFKLAAWPAFMVMIFFFEGHMDTNKAPNIIVGGLFGIANLITIKFFLESAAPALGLELAKLLYILVFVFAIVALGEVIPSCSTTIHSCSSSLRPWRRAERAPMYAPGRRLKSLAVNCSLPA